MGMVFRKFRLLLWKNFILQFRRPKGTVIEIVLPIGFLALLILARSRQVRKEHDSKIFNRTDIKQRSHDLFGYLEKLRLTNESKLRLAYFPLNNTKIVSLLQSATNEISVKLVNQTLKNETFVDLDHILDEAKRYREKYLGVIQFHGNEFDVDGKIEYSIRLHHSTGGLYNEDDKSTWYTNEVYRRWSGVGSGPSSEYQSPFLSLQYHIDTAILRMKSGNRTVTTARYVRQFPFPSYTEDDFIGIAKGFISIMFTIGFMYTASQIVKELVIEKEYRLMECMKMMGLPTWIHLTAWFVKCLIWFVVIAALQTAVLKGGKIFRFTDASVTFLALLIWSLSSICFLFLCSTFFSKVQMAQRITPLLWYALYIPNYFFNTPEKFGALSSQTKTAMCLLPNACLGIMTNIIMDSENEQVGINWGNINEAEFLIPTDSFTLANALLILLVDCILFMFLAWYFGNVFPGDYGVPKPFYFLFLPSFWCKRKGLNVSPESADNDEQPSKNFEEEPTNLECGVKIKNLGKTFNSATGKKIAVDNLTLNIYKGQITALLGHNGAGKTTTFSMLTGLFPPSSGDAHVNGHNILTEMDEVRNSLGLCPQQNVLFDRLTVREHLEFFATLKGIPTVEAADEMENLMRDMGLSNKANEQSSTLSGGQKRKLSCAIALIGNPDTVILDEPTSGMDPYARRSTWDVLQRYRGNKTIILTTHFMDEADFLGDRIAIMKAGKVHCCGSSLFLKKHFGVGYHMTVVKAPNFSEVHTSSMIQNIVPTAKMTSNVASELNYILNEDASSEFSNLFRMLETKKEELGVNSFGISMTTLEEVFIKVGEEGFSFDGNVEKKEVNGSEDDETSRLQGSTRNLASIDDALISSIDLRLTQFKAMFVKRFLDTKRRWKAKLIATIVPILFLIGGLVTSKASTASSGKVQVNDPMINLRLTMLHRDHKDLFAFITPPRVDYRNISSKYYTSLGIKLLSPPNGMNFIDYILDRSRKTKKQYFTSHVAGIEINNDESVTAWYSNIGIHNLPSAYNAISNILLQRLKPNESQSQIVTYNHPLPKNKEEMRDGTADSLGGPIGRSIGLVSFHLMGISGWAAGFLYFPVKEKLNKGKHIQFVSGVNGFCYWGAYFCWDLIVGTINSIVFTVVFAVFNLDDFQDLGAVFLVTFMFSFSILPFMYLLSFLFKDPDSANRISSFLIMMLSIGMIIGWMVLSLFGEGDIGGTLSLVFLLIPTFAYPKSLIDIAMHSFCMKKSNLQMLQCDIAATKGIHLYTKNLYDVRYPGIGLTCLYMFFMAIMEFALVLIIEENVIGRILKRYFKENAIQSGPAANQIDIDQDVAQETNDLKHLKRSEYNSAAVIVKDLTKVYQGKGLSPTVVDTIAVDHINVKIPHGECFGLLGVNGAGKSTTFGMLTGDIAITEGDAYVHGYNLKTDLGKVQQRIGYCPQFDGLVDTLTGREMLRMFAQLRGIQDWKIEQVVQDVIKSLDLQDYADQMCGNYSGGNKRKLSAGMALVGDPPVVFLDEPSSGMDPMTRRNLWDTLSQVIDNGRSIVLTSHSMEECEALCTKLVIMVNGRFKCIGSVQHLKSRFGNGYTVMLKFKPDQNNDVVANNAGNGVIIPNHTIEMQVSTVNNVRIVDQVKNFVQNEFPSSALVEEFDGFLQYQVSLEGTTLSHLFDVLCKNQQSLGITDYSVSQTSLEQVFINFAKQIQPNQMIRKKHFLFC